MAKKKPAEITPKDRAPKWSVARDCLAPLGEFLLSLSREFGRPFSPSNPAPKAWVPIRLWGAYRDHKLDLALVCLEVAVSVPFADRLRERTSLVLKAWEQLHLEAVRAMCVTHGDDAIRIAEDNEYARWREGGGLPGNELPEDSFALRGSEISHLLQETGFYLLQSAAALRMVFASKSIPIGVAEHAAPGKGRPIEIHKRELIRDVIESGVVAQKKIQAAVSKTLKTKEKVSPKLISEVKKSMNGHATKE